MMEVNSVFDFASVSLRIGVLVDFGLNDMKLGYSWFKGPDDSHEYN